MAALQFCDDAPAISTTCVGEDVKLARDGSLLSTSLSCSPAGSPTLLFADGTCTATCQLESLTSVPATPECNVILDDSYATPARQVGATASSASASMAGATHSTTSGQQGQAKAQGSAPAPVSLVSLSPACGPAMAACVRGGELHVLALDLGPSQQQAGSAYHPLQRPAAPHRPTANSTARGATAAPASCPLLGTLSAPPSARWLSVAWHPVPPPGCQLLAAVCQAEVRLVLCAPHAEPHQQQPRHTSSQPTTQQQQQQQQQAPPTHGLAPAAAARGPHTLHTLACLPPPASPGSCRSVQCHVAWLGAWGGGGGGGGGDGSGGEPGQEVGHGTGAGGAQELSALGGSGKAGGSAGAGSAPGGCGLGAGDGVQGDGGACATLLVAWGPDLELVSWPAGALQAAAAVVTSTVAGCGGCRQGEQQQEQQMQKMQLPPAVRRTLLLGVPGPLRAATRGPFGCVLVTADAGLTLGGREGSGRAGAGEAGAPGGGLMAGRAAEPGRMIGDNSQGNRGKGQGGWSVSQGIEEVEAGSGAKAEVLDLRGRMVGGLGGLLGGGGNGSGAASSTGTLAGLFNIAAAGEVSGSRGCMDLGLGAAGGRLGVLESGPGSQLLQDTAEAAAAAARPSLGVLCVVWPTARTTSSTVAVSASRSSRCSTVEGTLGPQAGMEVEVEVHSRGTADLLLPHPDLLATAPGCGCGLTGKSTTTTATNSASTSSTRPGRCVLSTPPPLVLVGSSVGPPLVQLFGLSPQGGLTPLCDVMLSLPLQPLPPTLGPQSPHAASRGFPTYGGQASAGGAGSAAGATVPTSGPPPSSLRVRGLALVPCGSAPAAGHRAGVHGGAHSSDGRGAPPGFSSGTSNSRSNWCIAALVGDAAPRPGQKGAGAGVPLVGFGRGGGAACVRLSRLSLSLHALPPAAEGLCHAATVAAAAEAAGHGAGQDASHADGTAATWLGPGAVGLEQQQAQPQQQLVEAVAAAVLGPLSDMVAGLRAHLDARLDVLQGALQAQARRLEALEAQVATRVPGAGATGAGAGAAGAGAGAAGAAGPVETAGTAVAVGAAVPAAGGPAALKPKAAARSQLDDRVGAALAALGVGVGL